MPHKPGHFKPFTSFLNEGMKNTNREAGNINTPPNPMNTPIDNPMNSNLLDTPQFPDSAIKPPVEQPKPPSFLDNLTMNNKVTRNLMNPGKTGGGQLFGDTSGGIFDYGDIIGIEGEQGQFNPNVNIDPGTGGGGGGVAPDPTWDDFWGNWAGTIAEGYTSSMGNYADYDMTEGSDDYNYLMNQWQQFYNEAGGDVTTASSDFHDWLISGEYQPFLTGDFSDIGQTVDDELSSGIGAFPELNKFEDKESFLPPGFGFYEDPIPPGFGAISPEQQFKDKGTGLQAITPGPEYKNIWKDNYLSPPASNFNEYDVNQDGSVNISDIISMQNTIFGGSSDVNVGDIVAAMDVILEGGGDAPGAPGMISPGDIDELYKEPIVGAGETGMIGINPFDPPGVKPGVTFPRIPEDKINIADYKPIFPDIQKPIQQFKPDTKPDLPFSLELKPKDPNQTIQEFIFDPVKPGTDKPLRPRVPIGEGDDVGVDPVFPIGPGDDDDDVIVNPDWEGIPDIDFSEPVFDNIEDILGFEFVFDFPEQEEEEIDFEGLTNQEFWENTNVNDLLQMFMEGNFDLDGDGAINTNDYYGAMLVGGGDNPNNPLQPLLNALGEYLIPSYQMGPSFTGGGGMGGELARRLYYPSTTGGFASAGSGITGPSSNSIEDLLAQLQG